MASLNNESRMLRVAMEGLLQSLPEQINKSWYDHVTLGLSAMVGADHALIGRLSEDGERVHLISYCADRVIQENFSYALNGTPCETVLSRDQCIFEDGVIEKYPEDHMLRELSISGYLGQPVVDAEGRLRGIINCLFRTPVGNPELIRNIFNEFVDRIIGVLEKELADHWIDPEPPLP